MATTPTAIVIDQDVQARFDMKQVVRSSGLTVAGEANLGLEAITLATATRPDVIVVGVNEPMERPLRTVESLAAVLPETPIIVYSNARDIESIRKAMLAGARDFLTRTVRPETLRQSALKVMEAAENRRLQQLGGVHKVPTQGATICVFGAKGGIGKSTVAANLAVALAAQGNASVCLVDLDTGFGDLAGMLDMRADRTLADLARDLQTADAPDVRKYVQPHELSGLDVLAAPAVLGWRSVSHEAIPRVISLLSETYDIVILDTAGTLDAVTEMAFELATMVLWVTTSSYSSVNDSAEAIRALGALSYQLERLRIVVNSTSPDDAVRAPAIARALGREVFWVVPYDRKVGQSTHLGQPIVITAPASSAAKSLTELAAAIGGSPDRRRLLGGILQRPRVTNRAAQPIAEMA